MRLIPYLIFLYINYPFTKFNFWFGQGSRFQPHYRAGGFITKKPMFSIHIWLCILFEPVRNQSKLSEAGQAKPMVAMSPTLWHPRIP